MAVVQGGGSRAGEWRARWQGRDGFGGVSLVPCVVGRLCRLLAEVLRREGAALPALGRRVLDGKEPRRPALARAMCRYQP